MSVVREEKGSCLCGAVHFTAKTMNKNVGACHCMHVQEMDWRPLIDRRLR